MPRKSPHKRYLELETHLADLVSVAEDAMDLASILTDGPGVPYLLWHDAAEEMPKAIRRIENRLKTIKKLWYLRCDYGKNQERTED